MGRHFSRHGGVVEGQPAWWSRWRGFEIEATAVLPGVDAPKSHGMARPEGKPIWLGLFVPGMSVPK